MLLSPGSRLGPYEITGPIGAGGMGEVYKARDTRLTPDGQRFLVAMASQHDVQEPITIVLNWESGLKR